MRVDGERKKSLEDRGKGLTSLRLPSDGLQEYLRLATVLFRAIGPAKLSGEAATAILCRLSFSLQFAKLSDCRSSRTHSGVIHIKQTNVHRARRATPSQHPLQPGHQPSALRCALLAQMLLRHLDVQDLRELDGDRVEEVLVLEEEQDGRDHRRDFVRVRRAVERAEEGGRHDCVRPESVISISSQDCTRRQTTHSLRSRSAPSCSRP